MRASDFELTECNSSLHDIVDKKKGMIRAVLLTAVRDSVMKHRMDAEGTFAGSRSPLLLAVVLFWKTPIITYCKSLVKSRLTCCLNLLVSWRVNKSCALPIEIFEKILFSRNVRPSWHYFCRWRRAARKSHCTIVNRHWQENMSGITERVNADVYNRVTCLSRGTVSSSIPVCWFARVSI